MVSILFHLQAKQRWSLMEEFWTPYLLLLTVYGNRFLQADTYNCTPPQPSYSIIHPSTKFADGATMGGLISGKDESACRDEWVKLAALYLLNDLTLNISRRDFHKNNPTLPLSSSMESVEGVHSFKHLLDCNHNSSTEESPAATSFDEST